ncbi:testis-specific serine/threonine-protein kinase 6-like [Lagopus muta]|uniref:testis-specific serine/threonine-protein kinase 6-like n=1 Tax=Lagopus muta TaxID=64668 RepID=UPI00209FC38D|nr:testis-specific serine/threonine-protein kinase 6-like [Lagopus muta]
MAVLEYYERCQQRKEPMTGSAGSPVFFCHASLCSAPCSSVGSPVPPTPPCAGHPRLGTALSRPPMLGELDHPNIVLIFEIFELTDGMVYIVMESAAFDLQQRLQQLGKLPCVPDARDIFVQVVGAVHCLHNHNIVHRDLKCENILLSADGRQAKIDFSLSKEMSSYPEVSSTFCGTEAYMAPEMWLHYPHGAKKLDIWSLRVVLLAMVTGSLPFHGCLCNTIQHQKDGVQHLRGVSALPEPCQALLVQLLQFLPSSRPSVEQVASNSWLKGDN